MLLGFLLISIFMKHLLPSLTFSPYESLDMKQVSYRHHIYGSCFCIHLVSLCLSVGVFNSFTFKVITDICVLIVILLFSVCFCGCFSPLLLISSFVIWRLSLVLCLDCTFIFVFISIVDFWFVVAMKCWYSSLYIYKTGLSCWSLNFKCICNTLHLYCPLLKFAGFDIILACWWFPTFTVCLPLLMSFSVHNFLVSSCALFFST